MPCNTKVFSKVKFSMENTDINLLAEALRKKGFNVTLDLSKKTLTFARGYYESGIFKNGQFEVQTIKGQQFDVNAVKRAYSQEVVKKMQKTYGWQVEDQQNEFEFDVVKEAY